MPAADDKVICLGRPSARLDMTLIFRMSQEFTMTAQLRPVVVIS